MVDAEAPGALAEVLVPRRSRERIAGIRQHRRAGVTDRRRRGAFTRLRERLRRFLLLVVFVQALQAPAG